MDPRTIKLIFGSCCFFLNLVALLSGVALIFKTLPFIGQGEASAIVNLLGEISGVNGHAVGLFLAWQSCSPRSCTCTSRTGRLSSSRQDPLATLSVTMRRDGRDYHR